MQPGDRVQHQWTGSTGEIIRYLAGFKIYVVRRDDGQVCYWSAAGVTKGPQKDHTSTHPTPKDTDTDGHQAKI